jgi:hypothetical protein
MYTHGVGRAAAEAAAAGRQQALLQLACCRSATRRRRVFRPAERVSKKKQPFEPHAAAPESHDVEWDLGRANHVQAQLRHGAQLRC